MRHRLYKYTFARMVGSIKLMIYPSTEGAGNRRTHVNYTWHKQKHTSNENKCVLNILKRKPSPKAHTNRKELPKNDLL